MAKSAKDIRQVATHWQDIVLVCRKCSKKVHGGFGAKQRTRLDKALREELGIAKGRKGSVGFLPVACFGLCPKGAVTVSRASAPRDLHIVPRGTPLDEIVAALDLERFRETSG